MSVSINGTNGIVFNDGSVQKTSALTGFRNRIINGDMRIDQRNAGASITPTNTTPAYPVDRFRIDVSTNSKITAQQNSGSVTPPTGFTSYLGIVSTSSTVATTDYINLYQAIEGFNVSDLAFGSASAKQVTLSFWARSSLTGTFGGFLANGAQTRIYPFAYSISSANTWEYKTITIAGDKSGTWLTNNGAGLWVGWSMGAGSTYTGTSGSWSGSTLYGATGQTNLIATNGATFYITGVQLEAGSTATDFERRPYGTELALCQRYYEKGTFHSAGYISGSNGAGGSLYFRVEKRTAPTMAYNNTITSNVGVATTNQSIATDSVSLYRIGSSLGGYQFEQTWTASAEL